MPCILRRRRRTSNSVLPQPSPEISSLHALPHGHPWFEYRHLLLQALSEAAMQNATKDRVFQVRGPQVSKSLLAAAALFLILATVARAQQRSEERRVGKECRSR